MAKSPAHKFGQIIGNLVEAASEPLLQRFALEHNLYLDKKGTRPARKRRQKVTWKDSFGNTHDLDFVLERYGDDSHIGIPVAFIETAWRSYTKHSRNKAQEIQGAIQPLVETYQHAHPFVGTILAGVFTDGALTQLRSLGFAVLYFPYDTIVSAFRQVGIDARFDEATPDTEFSAKVSAWEVLPEGQRTRVARVLTRLNQPQVNEFMTALRRTVTRRIASVRVLALHGTPCELPSLEDAIDFVQRFEEAHGSNLFARYEIEISYNNGDLIVGKFADKVNAIQFLRQHQRDQ